MYLPPNLTRRNFVSRVYMAPMGRRHLCMEGEPGGGGGGGGGGDDPWKNIPAELKPTIEGLISKAVEAQVTGLKTKNGELIATQKQLKEQLGQFEGIDPQAVRTILQRFADDEEQGLIKAGKIDEVLSKRTERMKADMQKQLDAKDQAAAKLKAKADKLAERALAEVIMKASAKAGALPEALEDMVLRAKGAGWTIDDEGNPVARNGDDVIFGNDGKTPLSADEWAASLRESAPHLWPKATGSGAHGTNNPAKGGVDLSKLSPEARMTAHRAAQAGTR